MPIDRAGRAAVIPAMGSHIDSNIVFCGCLVAFIFIVMWLAGIDPSGFSKRLHAMIERLMSAMDDQESRSALRDEAQAVLEESIDHIKAKLGRAGFENEEIAARATKLLAEAEATKATAAKTRAEADEIKVRTLSRKLTMLLEAEQAMARGEMEGFLEVLKELGKA